MFLTLLLAITIGSQHAFSQAVTITLTPGWNWISYPNAIAMEVNEALATYAPLEGDMVKGAYSFAVYDQGRWIGGLTHFMPGRGYMYYSTRSEVTSFVFTQAMSSIVTTAQPTDITEVSAVVGGVVMLPEGSHVFLRGVCWGTEPSPDIDGNHTSDGSGIGAFVSILEGLDIETTYHIRAYAVTDYGLAYGSDVTFTTGLVYTITASSNPEEGGEISGMGTYQEDTECTLTATPNEGYTFTNWTEGGNQVSTNANYTFTVTGNRTLVANFTLQAVLPTVTTTQVTNITQATATGGGNVTDDGGASIIARGVCWSTSHNPTVSGNHTTNDNGIGSFTSSITELTANTTYYVRAYATNDVGTAYGSEVSFTTQPSYPVGAINGLFSVSETQQVYFSQGNLQYQASTNTWRFATNQYDYIGYANNNISSNYSGWIDLFGWGTSGYNHGANCYQPWSTSLTNSDYYAYGQYFYNLNDQNDKADWGYNPIINGNNTNNQWHTLTQPEWDYVFNTRSTISEIRYAKANVNGINGVILLPDDWNGSTYSLSNTNSNNASFNSNTISASIWATLESSGAVFLPAAGYRSGFSMYVVGSCGCYWSASRNASDGAYFVEISQYLYVNSCSRCYGSSVRLVKDYNP
jgi:uncharacterized repeat protein (TIGR02543 family)